MRHRDSPSSDQREQRYDCKGSCDGYCLSRDRRGNTLKMRLEKIAASLAYLALTAGGQGSKRSGSASGGLFRGSS